MTIIFTHVPKVAGTTLKSRLISPNFTESEIKEFKGIVDLIKNRNEDFSILVGHNPFGMGQFTSGKARYFTVLRDPIERSISHYFFILQGALHGKLTHNLEQRKTHLSTPLKDIFSINSAKRFAPATSWLIDNMQTRYTSGYMNSWRSKASSRLLKTAMWNLRERYDCFGLQERFEDSLTVISREFGWKVNPPAENKKSTYIPKNYSEVDLQAVKENNKLDQELFEFAKDLFRQRYG